MARKLSNEELAVLAQDDPTHEEELVRRNYGLIQNIALGCARSGMATGKRIPLDDLIQVGAIGFIDGVRKFDPKKGFKLSTYAGQTARGEILKHIYDEGMIRIPRNLKQKINKASNDFQRENGRSPTTEELALASGTKVEVICLYNHLRKGVQSLDEITSSARDKDSVVAARHMKKTLDKGSEMGFRLIEDRAETGQLLERLKPTEKRAVVLLYGLNGDSPLSRSEVAAQIERAPWYVSTLEQRALTKMRRALARQGPV